MAPYGYHLFFLLAAIHLLYIAAEDNTFEIVENNDPFKLAPCPGFLAYDTAAYLSEMTIELECKCKPESMTSIVWYYQTAIGIEPNLVFTESDGKTQIQGHNIYRAEDIMARFSIHMFNLIIFKAQKADSGHYICGTKNGHYFYGYNLDIQDSQETYLDFEDKNGHPQADVETKYFVAFTGFWDWTVCDRCDIRGEKKRLGLCYVKTPYLNKRYYVAEDDVAPCGSNAVPSRFRKQISHRKPEVAVKSCMVPCRKKKTGILGILSNMMNALKERVPGISKVPTQFHSHPRGKSLTLSCPGARPEHAVAWDKEGEPLYLSDYLTGITDYMRIYIDHGNHLNFRTVLREDDGVYYCWIQGKIKAGFRLAVRVDRGYKRGFTDPESIFAMKLISLSFLFLTIIFMLIHCIKCCNYNFKCPFL